MREILFRGKRVDNGEWVEGLLYKELNNFYGKSLFNIQRINKFGIPFAVYEIDPETVGQYTGLTDKNGNKIFEGDILSKGFDNVLVKWNQNQCRWGIYLDEYEISGFNESTQNYFEIIGNIHDNPELLRTPQNDEVRE